MTKRDKIISSAMESIGKVLDDVYSKGQQYYGHVNVPVADRVNLPIVEMLAGLAEECTELAQAALKLRRAYDQTNPTPVSKDDAYQQMLEEIADVFLYLEQIQYNADYVGEIMLSKRERWKRRLRKAEEEKMGKSLPQVCTQLHRDT